MPPNIPTAAGGHYSPSAAGASDFEILGSLSLPDIAGGAVVVVVVVDVEDGSGNDVSSVTIPLSLSLRLLELLDILGRIPL